MPAATTWFSTARPTTSGQPKYRSRLDRLHPDRPGLEWSLGAGHRASGRMSPRATRSWAAFSTSSIPLPARWPTNSTRSMLPGRGSPAIRASPASTAVDDANEPLDAAGLHFRPQTAPSRSGLQHQDRPDANQQHSRRPERLGHRQHAHRTSPSQLNPSAAFRPAINSQGQLTIAKHGPDQQFSFGNDTSGVLAAARHEHLLHRHPTPTIWASTRP